MYYFFLEQFIGSNSRNGIVYNWFTTAITTRYLKIIPMKVKNGVCLRLNVYGCPEKGKSISKYQFTCTTIFD